MESLRHIQPIWRQFQATKSLQTQRDHIRDKMKMWVDKFNFEIDPSLYFDKATIEDIINLRLTGGGPVAAFKSAERGNSFLTCVSRGTGETEESRRRDAAEERSMGTRDMTETLRLSSKGPRPPPSE